MSKHWWDRVSLNISEKMFHFFQYKMTWLISDLKIIVCTMNKYVVITWRNSLLMKKKNLVSNIIYTTWDLFHFGGWHFSFHLIVNIKNTKKIFFIFFSVSKIYPLKGNPCIKLEITHLYFAFTCMVDKKAMLLCFCYF